MSIEAYLSALPEGERGAARIALSAHCRDKQGNQSPVYHAVEEYIAAGWTVGRPNGRGLALVHECGDVLSGQELGPVGMKYAEYLSPKIEAPKPKRKPRKRKTK